MRIFAKALLAWSVLCALPGLLSLALLAGTLFGTGRSDAATAAMVTTFLTGFGALPALVAALIGRAATKEPETKRAFVVPIVMSAALSALALVGFGWGNAVHNQAYPPRTTATE